ncbi:aminoacyl-tRNA hydrolase [Bordetella hinzii]|uniref:Peptidyl-tRNA hydrolase n=1 Tax=Bordetella hinzii TaxID=103855 RepID=A0AAN1RU09_9BORD|nr:aminoacyl-tRNA hydrolase [Bordetella hinzii]AKQ58586.1 Peptidyl-tRNA hydrolase [Bordetella hinzii]AZW16111.1 aminoacyl-tRNA hydrolase [Bordetella hinzii]MBZ0075299.1 aminoacyl-tRNA hydrolase [Bordetella hinzii]MBZ0078332.1 aminoacyl-tRNA hydrolase [Bordetella hinzii]MBZ0084041.1 aminoacyl-tRNA hydrolase [Bordetella hinzii]
MSEPIRLIVGLGNPGPDYETTRHNAGFWLADHLADDLRASFTLEKAFMGQVAKARFEGDNVLLLKPITYMNRSGQAVGALARFYKLAPEQVLVLHDELDLLPGQVKMKQGGGHAGHNGLKDIQAALGTPNFWRLRIGIGHPRTLNLAQQVADFVLHPPRRDEQAEIEKVIDRCRAVVPALLRGDFALATRQLHAV